MSAPAVSSRCTVVMAVMTALVLKTHRSAGPKAPGAAGETPSRKPEPLPSTASSTELSRPMKCRVRMRNGHPDAPAFEASGRVGGRVPTAPGREGDVEAPERPALAAPLQREGEALAERRRAR